MYRGFYINLDDQGLLRLMQPTKNILGFRRLYRKNDRYVNSDSIHGALTEYLLSENIIDAQQVKKDWFPQIHADVFLSHSHRDIDLAKNFARYLNAKFDLTTFIDSEVWGYSDDLVNRLLDDEYYDENERRKIIAHVNIMLSSALTQMIDKTECLMFLNTDNSVRSMTCTDRALTDSAWMYHELFISSILPKKKLYRRSKTETQESLELLHTLPLDHLTYLDSSDLRKWNSEWNIMGTEQENALDYLYMMHPED